MTRINIPNHVFYIFYSLNHFGAIYVIFGGGQLTGRKKTFATTYFLANRMTKQMWPTS